MTSAGLLVQRQRQRHHHEKPKPHTQRSAEIKRTGAISIDDLSLASSSLSSLLQTNSMLKASPTLLARALRTRGANRLAQQFRSPLAAAATTALRCFPATSSVILRPFSDSSHDDFAPQRKTVEDSEAIQMIQEHVDNNPIMLYMKGSPKMPMCGFSARVVQCLQAQGVDFSSVNVLDYPSIREGVKQFSQWPTIPQLYVKGEFIGGCDIITDLHESGELAEMLQEFKTASAEE